MASLYDIDARILSLIDEETGEIADVEAFNALEIERDAKLENIAMWIKNLKADAEMYKAEKQRFAERQQAAERKAESLKKYLAEALHGISRDFSRAQCSFRKSEIVNISDVYLIPKDYLRYSEPTADKAAIKAAIKSGKEIAGAEIVTKLNLQIK